MIGSIIVGALMASVSALNVEARTSYPFNAIATEGEVGSAVDEFGEVLGTDTLGHTRALTGWRRFSNFWHRRGRGSPWRRFSRRGGKRGGRRGGRRGGKRRGRFFGRSSGGGGGKGSMGDMKKKMKKMEKEEEEMKKQMGKEEKDMEKEEEMMKKEEEQMKGEEKKIAEEEDMMKKEEKMMDKEEKNMEKEEEAMKEEETDNDMMMDDMKEEQDMNGGSDPGSEDPTDEPSTSSDKGSGSCGDGMVQKKVAMDNKERSSPVKCDSKMSQAAYEWSKAQCSQGMSHNGFSGRCSQAGVSSCKENVAYNYDGLDGTVDRVHQQWMTSPGHNKNIMASDNTKVGYGWAACGDGRIFWTGLYGK